MLIRSNPGSVYSVQFVRDHRGVLIVTKRFIIATGIFAQCWQ